MINIYHSDRYLPIAQMWWFVFNGLNDKIVFTKTHTEDLIGQAQERAGCSTDEERALARSIIIANELEHDRTRYYAGFDEKKKKEEEN